MPAEVPADVTDAFTRRSIWADHCRGFGISMDGLVRSAGSPLQCTVSDGGLHVAAAQYSYPMLSYYSIVTS